MAKRALCVGINDYPDSSMDLAGCVNDASDWRQVLEGRGYIVTSLLDAEATRQRMLDALDQLVSPASDGDALVFTFSGHGSWMPDADADEPDARDEMLCPHDVMQDHYVLDDDLHGVFARKAAGARLLVIADCCHSGSVIRSAPAAPGPVVKKARFLPPYVLARGDRNVERAIDQVRYAPAPARRSFPAVLLSACRDHELSYDTEFGGRANGAFTRAALDALAPGADVTPQGWFDRIRQQLPSDTYPQTPQLSGATEALTGPLF